MLVPYNMSVVLMLKYETTSIHYARERLQMRMSLVVEQCIHYPSYYAFIYNVYDEPDIRQVLFSFASRIYTRYTEIVIYICAQCCLNL